MIAGAMDELVIGDPANLETDVGPVINAAAADGLGAACGADAQGGAHREGVRAGRRARARQFLRAASHRAQERRRSSRARNSGRSCTWCATDPRDIHRGAAAIRASHYGLTLGVQTRLESFWRQVFANTSIGNTYVNRNMIGAVVGVQPFGGNGLSGTGPKAGGPHYLDAIRERAHTHRQYHGDGRQRGAAESWRLSARCPRDLPQ